MIRGFFRRRIADPLLALLRQGISPERIALSIALGVILGVIPVLGSTSLLCLLAAAALRLNLPAIQLVNFIVYPLQLTLLIPFLRLGAWTFHAPPLALSLSDILHLVRANALAAIEMLGTATLHALAVWAVLGALAASLLYALLTPALRRFSRRPPETP